MANTLRTLIVDFKANTASFIGDLDKAANSAKRAGKEIQGALGQLGSIAGTALAPFGAMGATVASSLGGIGSAIGKNLTQAKSMGSVFKAAGAGAAAATVGVATGVAALAIHATEGAAKLGKLSQQTGVTVSALSGLSFAAKKDPEELAQSLNKLNKAAFAAATAPEGTKNAFTRLGVAVKGANGEIRPTQDIFMDLAAKFAAMPNGVTKSALAMQLFGKSGAAMIPALNKGKEGIQELRNTAQQLGIVIDDKTAAAAQNFRASLGVMKAAGDGLTNKLMVDLLPAFNAVTDTIVGGLKKPGSAIDALIKGFGNLVKAVVSAGGLIGAIFKQLGASFGASFGILINGLGNLFNAAGSAAMGDFKGAKDSLSSLRTEGTAQLQQFFSDSKDIWSDYAKFSVKVFSPLSDAKPTKGAGDGRNASVDTSAQQHKKPQRQDPTVAELANLREKLEVSKQLLAIAGQDEQTQQRARAQAEAQTEILKLGEQIARQKNVHTSNYASLVSPDAQKKIRGSYSSITQNNSQAELKNTLGASSRNTQAAVAGYTSLVAAIQRGRDATTEANARLQAETELRGKGATAVQMQTRVTEILTEQRAKERAEAQQTIEDAKFELDWQTKLNAAVLEGAEAYRQAQLEKEMATIDRGSGSSDQKGQLKQQATLRSQQQVAGEINQSVAQLVNADAERWNLLVKQNNELSKQSQNTVAAKLAVQSMNSELLQLQDKALLSGGSMTGGATTAFNEVVLQAKNAAQIVHEVFTEAFEGLNNNLSAAMVGQKTNWSGMFKQMGQSTIKSGLQTAESGLMKSLGFGKADGSRGNPYHVVVDSGIGSLSSAGAAAGSISQGFTGQLSSAFGSLGSSASSVLKGFGKVFSGLFGGFFASGGDIGDPYKTYMVGENGPELFTPGVAGHVTNNRDTQSLLSSGTVVNTYNIDATGTNAADVDRRVRQGSMAAYRQAVHDSQAQRADRNARVPSHLRS